MAGKPKEIKKSDINGAELLYRISKAMAAVKDGRELLKIIIAETQTIFGFYDIGLAVLDKSGKFFTDWSVLYQEISPSELNAAQRELQNFQFPVDEPLMQYAIERVEREKKPFIENMSAEFAVKFADFPHLPLEIEYGYKQYLATTLKFRGETLGVFNFNSLRENHFDNCDFELFQAIADLVAVAVANITAREEIIERERERAILLKITEQAAKVRDFDELFALVSSEIKPLLRFDDFVMTTLPSDGETHRVIISQSEVEKNERINHETFIENAHRDLSIADDPWFAGELIYHRETPSYHTVTGMLEKYPDYFWAKMMRETNLAATITTTLKHRSKIVGGFFIHYEKELENAENLFPLIQSIANQLSTTVANILANDEIKTQLVKIRELKKRLEAENKYLVEEVRKNYNFEEIIGTSPRLNEVFEVIEQVAPTDATVLIQGETGTGKELAARAVHNRSTRNARPLIKINCAALPRELVESELFGHEKGSFTGAFERRLGKFELADKGTIFLDEIGELPLEIQVKLLRVLQEKEIERLGGKNVIRLDLRVIAATNRNLAAEVQAGRFRADLYYRLCTVELFMPPLRERKEDIEPLTMYFARKYAAKFSRRIERISSEMLAELNAYNFPGNIRELEHIVEHAVIFSKNEKLILPRPLTLNGENKAEITNKPSIEDEPQTLESIEREHIIEILRQTAGRIKGKRGAAEILGLNPATVYFRMKKLGIEKS